MGRRFVMIIMICYDLLKYSCIEMMKTILSKGLMIIENSSVNLCALFASVPADRSLLRR